MANTKDRLKFSQFNADGLLGKKKFLDLYLFKNNIDVCNINEVKTKRNLKFKDYNVIRKDRKNRSGGGVMTLIKKGINYREIAINFNSKDNEVIVYELTLVDGSKIVIANIYSPRLLYLDLLRHLYKLNNKIFIMGDLNSHNVNFGSRKTNANGRTLAKFLSETHFVIHNKDLVTHIDRSHHNHSCLDVILANPSIVHKLSKAFAPNDLGSDHFPVEFDMRMKFKFTPKFKMPYFDYSKANWESFRINILDKINQINPTLKLSAEIEKNASLISKIIFESAEKSIPIRKPSGHSAPPLPLYLLHKITIKNRTRKLYMETRDPITKSLVNKQEKEIKKAIRSFEKQKLSGLAQKVKSLDPSSSEFYRHYHNLAAETLHEPQNEIPPLKDTKTSNTIYESNKEKADAFSNYLNSIFSDHNNLKYSFLNKFLVDNYCKILDNQILKHKKNNLGKLCKEISINEFMQNLKKCVKKKAPGDDGISGAMIKELPYEMLEVIRSLFNNILISDHYPDIWKLGKIIMLPKPKKNHELISSYRPICLLSQIGKIFERIIQSRLSKILEDQNLYYKFQNGFRKNKGTSDVLCRLISSISKGFNQGQNPKMTALLMVDFAKAFDTVWHKAILYKLQELNFHLEDISLIKNYLKNRRFYVQIEDQKSKICVAENGVPQGGIISPTLFNIFTFDLPSEEIIQALSKASAFADDASGWRTAHSINSIKTSIQTIMDSFVNWSNLWRIDINADKCKILMFLQKINKKIPLPKIEITLGDTIVENVHSEKLLGLTLDNTLSWKPHVKSINSKIYLRGKVIKSLRYRGIITPLQTLTLYKSLIRSIIEYAAPAWINRHKNIENYFQVIQNNYLRLAFRKKNQNPSIANLHNLGNIEKISDRTKRLTKNYFDKNRDNPTLVETFSEILDTNYINEGWHTLIKSIIT